MSESYMLEFIEWLYEQSKTSNKYSEFIESFGVDLDCSSTAEVEKGKYDSIALPNTTIISLYGDTLGTDSSKLYIYQGEPIIVSGSNIKKGQVVDMYVTQNPYSRGLISGWDTMHNSGTNLCVGVFGNNYDKDKDEKLKFISQFIEKLSDDYICEYDTVENSYMCFVKSNRKKLVKVLIR